MREGGYDDGSRSGSSHDGGSALVHRTCGKPVVARAEEVGAGVGVEQSGATEHAEAPRDARYRLRAGLAVVGAEKIASLRPT